MEKHAGTDIIELIFHKDKPNDIKATYVRSVCDIRPHKIETRRSRLTAGRNLIYYPGDVITPTSDLATTKLHVNSAIPYIKARYMCMDVKCFHLNNIMNRTEYIMIRIAMIPQGFVVKYNIQEKAHNGYIYSRVTKAMYVLPQAGRIAHDALVKHLDSYGYHPSNKTLVLWTHKME